MLDIISKQKKKKKKRRRRWWWWRRRFVWYPDLYVFFLEKRYPWYRALLLKKKIYIVLCIVSSSMEATKFSLPYKLPCRPFSFTKPHQRRRGRFTVAASVGEKNKRDYWGRQVDENMIMLRLRIKEMKIKETNYEPPSNWMEWEKQYYSRYNNDVYEALGLLQGYIMNMRPSLAFGVIALVTFSVLISAGVGLFHAIYIVKRIYMGFL